MRDITPPVPVLYEDNHLLAVVKPAGMLVQGDATGDRPLLDILKAYIKDKYEKPGDVFLGLVHRLDRPVSGAMVFARTSKAAGRLSEQFRARRVEKIYHAVVEGRPPKEADTLTHYLTGGKHHTRVAAHTTEKPRSKEARLRYRMVDASDTRCVVEIELLTGAKHQIRAQLSAVGCPIVGDFKYDNRRPPAQPERLFDGRAIALHAARLTIEHPTQREPLTFEAPPPPYWPVV